MEQEKLCSIPLTDQETVISYGRTEDYAMVWTNDKTVMTKLDRLCERSPDNYICTEVGRMLNGDGITDKQYKIMDKGLLSFRSNRVKIELTEEQKAERAERLRLAYQRT